MNDHARSKPFLLLAVDRSAGRRAFLRGVALTLGIATSLVPTGCAGQGPSSDRCAHCGMRVDPRSTWRAGAVDARGGEVVFDAPKCLLGWLHGPAGRGARAPWASEYYGGQRRAAEGLFYVLGSDVDGPMGADVVPIEGRPRADRFASDHHASRVLAWSELDAGIVASLFGRR